AASDGADIYSRDPGGSIVGVAVNGGGTGTGRVVLTDAHTDIVGQITASASTLTGSTTYDPLGNVVATSGQIGNLGFQSGWTDPTTSNVDMAARWYNPAVGQFFDRDSYQVSPTPDEAAANPFAYVGDDPLGGTDPSGHCGIFCHIGRGASHAFHAATTWVSHAIGSAWGGVTSAASFVSHESRML